MTLLLHMDRPEPREQDGVRAGPVRLGLVASGEHSLIMLYLINDAETGWQHTCYGLGGVPVDQRHWRFDRELSGEMLTIALADISQGCILVTRDTVPSASFMQELKRLLNRLWSNLPDFRPSAYEAEIEAAARRWRSSRDMLADALVLEAHE